MNTTQTEGADATLARLTELLRAATTNLNSPAAPAFTTWPQPPTIAPGQPPGFQGPTAPVGLLVPLTIQTAAGEVGVYVALPGTAASNPAVVISQMQQAGWPVRTYNRSNSAWQSQPRRFGRW